MLPGSSILMHSFLYIGCRNSAPGNGDTAFAFNDKHDQQQQQPTCIFLVAYYFHWCSRFEVNSILHYLDNSIYCFCLGTGSRELFEGGMDIVVAKFW